MGFGNLDSVRQHRDRAVEYVAQQAVDIFNGSLGDADLECESPIEAIFMLWWKALEMMNVLAVRDLDLECQHIHTIDAHQYRLDFSVTPGDKTAWLSAHEMGVLFQSVGVELDGHDFHERTKEQVIARNQRDRDFQTAGWRILHFSGTELYRDPVAVVMEVASAGTDALNSLRTRHYVAKAARQRAQSAALTKQADPVGGDAP